MLYGKNCEAIRFKQYVQKKLSGNSTFYNKTAVLSVYALPILRKFAAFYENTHIPLEA